MNESTIKAIQGIIGVDQDGKWGPKSKAALDAIIQGSKPKLASSFADPADVRAFRHCKDQGKTDAECFRVGDNGIGCWGDDVSQGTGPSCALPPDDMISRWGSVNEARHKPVNVKANGQSVVVILKDRMPWKKNITNGAVIDLNPDAVAAIGLKPPIMVPVEWDWA